MKGERVSYDVMTPSAARGIIESVYWKPAIQWIIDRIMVLNPIVFGSVRRNELGNKIPPRNVNIAMSGGEIDLHQYITEDRQQRSTLMLLNVAYVIYAHFELNPDEAGPGDTPEKHYNMAVRRMRMGQCFHQPYFGCREFPAQFRFLEPEEADPVGYYSEASRDLGWMLKDIDYAKEYEPAFFRANLNRGVVEVPR
jgi:CRISPR-associated protein Cas5 subtype I-C